MSDHNDRGNERRGARGLGSRSPRGSHPSTSQATADAGMQVLSYVIAGILVYGGLGWLIDHFWHQSWGVPVGLVVGMGLSIFMIIKRFGSQA